jgi:ammonia channel protein AmtB
VTPYMVLTTGKPDPSMVANGLLAGLVAITDPSGFVDANAGFIENLRPGALQGKSAWPNLRTGQVREMPKSPDTIHSWL